MGSPVSRYSTCIQLTKNKPIPFDVYRPFDAYLTYLWLPHVHDWPTPNPPWLSYLLEFGRIQYTHCTSYASRVAAVGSASPKRRPQNTCLLHQLVCPEELHFNVACTPILGSLNQAKMVVRRRGQQRKKVSQGKRAFSFRVRLTTGRRTHCKSASHPSSILNLSKARFHRPDP